MLQIMIFAIHCIKRFLLDQILTVLLFCQELPAEEFVPAALGPQHTGRDLLYD